MFDWQTDEDEAWEGISTASEAAPPPRRHWPLMLVLLLSAALTVGAGGWYLAQQRITQISAQLEEEVLASRSLIATSAEQDDVELLQALLSGADAEWYRYHQAHLNAEEWNGRYDLPYLPLHRSETQATEPAVSFNPDFTEAYVRSTERRQDSFGITVSFEREEIYRPGQTRWLLAPPTHDYWQGRANRPESYGRYTYPERDAEILERLIPRFEGLLAQLCGPDIGLPCPGSVLRLEFSTAVDSFPDAERGPTDRSSLQLPTPSLIGKPVDAAAEEALFRAYAIEITYYVFARELDYSCCDSRQIVFKPIFQYLIAELALIPAIDADYAAYFNAPFSISATLFTGNYAAWQLNFIFEFALATTDNTLFDLLRANTDTPMDWMLAVFGDSIRTIPQRSEQLFEFALQNSALASVEERLNDYAQDLLVSCSSTTKEKRYQRFDPQTNSWQALASPLNSADKDIPFSIMLLPDDTSWIWQTPWDFQPPALALIDFPESDFLIPLDDSFDISAILGIMENHLTYYNYRFDDTASSQAYFSLNLAECRIGNCAPQSEPGNTIWSRDGRYKIVNRAVDGVYLVEVLDLHTGEVVQEPVEETEWVWNWINGRRLISVYHERNIVKRVTIRSLSGGQIEELDLNNRLPALLGEEPRAGRRVLRLYPLPGHPDELLIIWGEDSTLTQNQSILRYNYVQNEAAWTLRLDAGTDIGAINTSNSTFIVLWELTRPFGHLVDTETGQILRTLATDPLHTRSIDPTLFFDWSADGRWLAQFSYNHMHLIAPASGEDIVVRYPEGVRGCTGGGWIYPRMNNGQ